MNKLSVPIAVVALFALVPILLASSQQVPARDLYQQVVLLGSLAAFGLMLAQFWLSRRLQRSRPQVPMEGVFRFHRYSGYLVGGLLLLHPLLMIARRFWVQESDPVDNLLLLLKSTQLLPAIIAWLLLAVIVVLSPKLMRRKLGGRIWRPLHGLVAVGFIGLATWHVVAIGRHSDRTMSAWWIALAVGAAVPLLAQYLPARLKSAL